MVESCKYGRGKTYLNPIIDWSDDDVWEYIRQEQLPYCSLYDEGFKRLGCVLCPMQMPHAMTRDAKRWPRIAKAYERAFDRMLEARRAAGMRTEWTSGADVMHWWIACGQGGMNRDQVELFPMDN